MNNNFAKHLARLSIFIGLCTLSGCGHFPGAYTLPIAQGNALRDDQVTQLRVGMNTEQVRFLLGTPVLQDVFHSHRWDYVYYSTEKHKLKAKRHLVVFFEGGVVSHFEGDLVEKTGSALS